MIFRFSLMFFLLYTILAASCIDRSATLVKSGVLYRLGRDSAYSGCVIGYYNDGKKESEIIYANGNMVAKKLYNRLGDMYSFERYVDGKPLLPVEMTYVEAEGVCQKALFNGYHDWKLPSKGELYSLPFSELTRDMSYIASNPPKIKGNGAEVTYVHFGSDPASPKWDNDDLDISAAMNVICVRKKDASRFHLVSGVGGIADLAESSKVGYPTEKKHMKKKFVVKQKVAQKSKAKQKVLQTLSRKPQTVKKSAKLRQGYYICIYTYSKYPPKKEKLDNIMLSGYRYKFSDIIVDAKSLTRVLVGPFPNKQKARKELKRVHRLIEADAYIVKYIR